MCHVLKTGLRFEDGLCIAEASSEVRTEIRRVVNQANEVFPRVFPQDRLSRDGLMEDYAEQRAVLLYAGDELVGCELLDPKTNFLQINLLAVDPCHQGRGFGKLLLCRAAEICRESGHSLLGLFVVEHPALIRFYERCGFREVSRETKPAGVWNAREPFELLQMHEVIATDRESGSSANRPQIELHHSGG